MNRVNDAIKKIIDILQTDRYYDEPWGGYIRPASYFLGDEIKTSPITFDEGATFDTDKHKINLYWDKTDKIIYIRDFDRDNFNVRMVWSLDISNKKVAYYEYLKLIAYFLNLNIHTDLGVWGRKKLFI